MCERVTVTEVFSFSVSLETLGGDTSGLLLHLLSCSTECSTDLLHCVLVQQRQAAPGLDSGPALSGPAHLLNSGPLVYLLCLVLEQTCLSSQEFSQP